MEKGGVGVDRIKVGVDEEAKEVGRREVVLADPFLVLAEEEDFDEGRVDDARDSVVERLRSWNRGG